MSVAGQPTFNLGQEARMLKLLFAVIALIAAVIIAGVYYSFNPVIPIFVILGFGVYGVIRIGGPALPADAPVTRACLLA